MNNKYTNKINEYESKGLFNEHVTPPSTKYRDPDPNKFNYRSHNIFYRIALFFVTINLFWLGPIITFFMHGLKIKDRRKIKQLKGKGAILVANHVMAMEALGLKQLRIGTPVYYLSLKENYYPGFRGTVMMLGGILPIYSNITLSRKLDKTIQYIIEHKGFVTVFAEQALWPGYTRIRPFKKGAFHSAAKLNCPIVPVVTLFRPRKWYDKLLGRKYCLTMQVLDPIYPDSTLTAKDNIDYLMNTTHANMLACANNYYGTDSDATHYTSNQN